MRNPAVIGPTRSMNARPAYAASRSRAHGSCASSRLVAASVSAMTGLPVSPAALRVLLYPGEEPPRPAIDRLHEVPQLIERLRHGVAVFAQRAVKANARDVAIALLHDFGDVGVKRHDFGRNLRAARSEITSDFCLHFGGCHVGQQRAIAPVVRRLQPAKLLFRLGEKGRGLESERVGPAGVGGSGGGAQYGIDRR